MERAGRFRQTMRVATQGKSVQVLCFVTLMSHDCWQVKGHIFLSFRRVTAAKYSTNQHIRELYARSVVHQYGGRRHVHRNVTSSAKGL